MLSPREMLSFEKLLSTSIKNRAEVTQLQTELTRIEKEKQNELRMLNNEKQRFKARYSKSSFTPEYLTYEVFIIIKCKKKPPDISPQINSWGFQITRRRDLKKPAPPI